jgi:ketosteroid isomerase-like protein
VYRVKNRKLTQYPGRYLYVLKRGDDGWRIRHKRSELDLEGLWEQGTVSILR